MTIYPGVARWRPPKRDSGGGFMSHHAETASDTFTPAASPASDAGTPASNRKKNELSSLQQELLWHMRRGASLAQAVRREDTRRDLLARWLREPPFARAVAECETGRVASSSASGKTHAALDAARLAAADALARAAVGTDPLDPGRLKACVEVLKLPEPARGRNEPGERGEAAAGVATAPVAAVAPGVAEADVARLRAVLDG